MSDHRTNPSQDQLFFFEKQQVVVHDFPSSGYILDIGGGGEGIIGILKTKVVAIDLHRAELAEAPPGPLKVVMDARDLQFLDDTFDTATAFFALMYLKSKPDFERVFAEVSRVLQSGGQFLIWDVTLPGRLDEEKELFAIPLLVKVGDREIETGYAQRWPDEPHDLAFYVDLAEAFGFRVVEQSQEQRIFFLHLQKP